VSKPKKETEMTRQNEYTFGRDIAKIGLDAVPELMRILINNNMQVERLKYLQADEYGRIKDRIAFLCWQVIRLLKIYGYSNSFYRKGLDNPIIREMFISLDNLITKIYDIL
jgi:hypothetical protein